MTPPTATIADRSSELPGLDWGRQLSQNERWLRAVIYARVGEAEAVDEVFQEVSLAALSQKSPLLDPNKANPWLYRLAVLQSLLYRRGRGRRRKLQDRLASSQPDRSGHARDPDPLRWVIAAEQRKLVRRSLAALAGRDAEILLLKYGEDWSYRQIAEQLGISESAVETRLHRARKRLREELEARETSGVSK
jgi:RNA polymerase sigma factor (sigma-70 family)